MSSWNLCALNNRWYQDRPGLHSPERSNMECGNIIGATRPRCRGHALIVLSLMARDEYFIGLLHQRELQSPERFDMECGNCVAAVML